MPWPWCLYYPHGVTRIKLEIKDTTETDRSASYCDLDIDSEGQLRTKLYDKTDDFIFYR